MKNINYLIIILLISISLFTTNCKKDHPDTNGESTKIKSEINEFIWGGLNYWYLWVDSVPKLSQSYYQNNVNNLNAFLAPYTDHEKLFNYLLYKQNVVDKWSWIVKDYNVLDNELQGITKSMGYDFGLLRYGSGNNVFGYVRYVYPNSPALAAGIKRGDVFTKVDGQQITVSNYLTLLLNKDSYKLSFADIVSYSPYVVPNTRQVSITAEVLQENPIFMDTVFTVNNKKIGYLIYNGFYPDFDNQLNDVFKKFKDANIQKLILDLRYNGGGSIQSAIYLASMIYSTNTSKVFAKTKYNNAVQAEIQNYYGTNYFTDYFTDTIARATPAGAPTTITSLGLTSLYVITTGSTASASEMVINGLKPYINVVTIGTNTVGKYVGSITIKDRDSTGIVNPDHTWAMQPIVLKVSNANNISDYTNGFTPNVNVDELNYLGNLLPLGNTSEALLYATIQYINNNVFSSKTKSELAFQKIADAKDLLPHSKEMYRDPKFLPHKMRKKI